MEGLWLLILYILMLTGHIVNLIYRYRNKNGWWVTLGAQVLSITLAIFLGRYYDNREGFGMMPGLSYLGEVLFSYAAAISFAVIFIVSIFLFVKNKHQKSG